MSTKPEVIKYSVSPKKTGTEMVVKIKDETISQNTVTQPKVKTVTQPVAGEVHTTVEGGHQVPVESIITKPVNQQQSISGTITHSKKLPEEVTKAVSFVAPKNIKQNTIITKNIVSPKNETFTITIKNTADINEKSELKSEKEPGSIRTSGKHEADSELESNFNKKFKSVSFTLKQNTTIPLDHSQGDDSGLMDQEIKTEVIEIEGDNDFSDASYAGNVDNECTTPEYLDDEGDVLVIQSEDSDNTESELTCNVTSLCKIEVDEIKCEEQYSDVKAEPAQSNTIESDMENNLEVDSTFPSHKTITSSVLENSDMRAATASPKLFHTPTPVFTNIFRGTNTPYRNSTAKRPKINDKFPELPVPQTINQYGDCLKTRLGRYHCGLTLTDPPCQFFQGVLKNASGQTLAVLFGDINLITKFEGIPLEAIGHFAIDTTFRVIPDSTDGVNHLLTICMIIENQPIPLWFAVTFCSSPELYKRILIEFQQHVLDWPFISVLANNDPALCKAILSVFPDIQLYGSWFHYCQSIWKELAFNNLLENFKEDSTLMTAVKLLMVIPYLPPLSDTPSSLTMLEGFEVVRRFVRENNLPKEFNNVLNYVAAFWFNKVKSKNFTTFGKQTSSLNYIEVFQLALLSFMKPNGDIWTLTHSFQNVARSASTDFNRYLNGKPLVKKKNRGKKLNVPIRQNMKRLMLGTYDVKTYLEKCVVYCEELLDIFLHPLYPTKTDEKSNFIHTEGWKIRINQ